MSNKELILEYLKQGNSITPLEAFNLFGCMRLSAVIYDIKKDGYEIETERVVNKNRRNNICAYAKYTLKGE